MKDLCSTFSEHADVLTAAHRLQKYWCVKSRVLCVG